MATAREHIGQAIEDLVAQGKRPTMQAVQEVVGHSQTTIYSVMDEWYAELGKRLNAVERPPDIPPEAFDLVRALVETLNVSLREQAKAAAQAKVADERAKLAQAEELAVQSVRKAEREVAALTARLARESEDRAAVEASRAALAGEIETLRERLAEFKGLTERLGAENAQLAEQLRAVEKARLDREAEVAARFKLEGDRYDAMESRYVQQAEDWRNQALEAQALVKQLSGTVDSLRDALNAKATEAADAAAALKSATGEILRLRTETEQAQAAIAKDREAIVALQQELAAERARREVADQTLAAERLRREGADQALAIEREERAELIKRLPITEGKPNQKRRAHPVPRP